MSYKIYFILQLQYMVCSIVQFPNYSNATLISNQNKSLPTSPHSPSTAVLFQKVQLSIINLSWQQCRQKKVRYHTGHPPDNLLPAQVHRNCITCPELSVPSIARCQKRFNRHRKHLLHLVRIRYQGVPTKFPDGAHHRRNGRSKVRYQFVSAAPDVHTGPRNSDFLLGFPQGTRFEVGIPRISDST